MKIKGKISILIGQEITSIEIKDDEANTTFAKIELTPIQFQACLSRLSDVNCEIEVMELDKVGKKHENTTFSFKIPEILRSSSKSEELRQIAQDILDKQGDGWIADGYFGSQKSFSWYKDECIAHVTIRRYI